MGAVVHKLDRIALGTHVTMRAMFEFVYGEYDVTWYGYADPGTLFDKSLYPALKMLENCPNITRKGNMLLGQSHTIEVRNQHTMYSKISI